MGIGTLISFESTRSKVSVVLWGAQLRQGVYKNEEGKAKEGEKQNQ